MVRRSRRCRGSQRRRSARRGAKTALERQLALQELERKQAEKRRQLLQQTVPIDFEARRLEQLRREEELRIRQEQADLQRRQEEQEALQQAYDNAKETFHGQVQRLQDILQGKKDSVSELQTLADFETQVNARLQEMDQQTGINVLWDSIQTVQQRIGEAGDKYGYDYGLRFK